MKINFLFFASLLFALNVQGADKAEQDSESWLAMVDAGAYEDSWGETATLFQQQVTSPQWVSALSKVRSPLGAVASRSIIQRSEHSSLPGAPEGSYVVLVYETDFQNKTNSQETVALALTGGAWRVAGYFIK